MSAGQFADLLAGLEVPQADPSPSVRRREPGLGTVGDAHRVAARGEDGGLLAGVQIPHTQRPIRITAAGQRLARRTEGDAVHRYLPTRLGAGYLAEFLAGVGVPQPHGVVSAARQHALAIRRQRRAEEAAGVSREDAQLFAGVGVPQPQRAVVDAAGQQAFAVGRDADAIPAVVVDVAVV